MSIIRNENKTRAQGDHTYSRQKLGGYSRLNRHSIIDVGIEGLTKYKCIEDMVDMVGIED